MHVNTDFYVDDALDTLEKAQMGQCDDDDPVEKINKLNIAIELAIESLKEAR